MKSGDLPSIYSICVSNFCQEIDLIDGWREGASSLILNKLRGGSGNLKIIVDNNERIFYDSLVVSNHKEANKNENFEPF
jgi:hypothetical protein